MALHEREVQRPPGQADHRHVDQLALQEELQERNAPVQRVLQDEDVHPRLVIAIDQVPVRVAQAGVALDVPLRLLDAGEPAGVAGHPGRRNGGEQRVDAPPDRGERQNQLEQGHGEQQQAPEQRADGQQQHAEGARDPCEPPARHGERAAPPRGGDGIVRAAVRGGRRVRFRGLVWKSHGRQCAAPRSNIALRRIKRAHGAHRPPRVKAGGISPRDRPSSPIAHAPALLP